MFTYCCLTCKRNTENVDSKVLKAKNGRLMLSSKCTVPGNKKMKFYERTRSKGLLSSLGLKTLLKKIPLIDDILFELRLDIKWLK